MDIQSILLLILSLLSINLILVGVYIVIVLRDVRRLIKNFDGLVVSTKESLHEVSGSLGTLPLLAKTIFQVYKSVKSNDSKKK
ncbi:hypothetical protein COV24_01285 [candidate division WWE3 bacterium CG10_big_fil_rev_8_21_14_0_10_32_10]|uniref:Uncharacterized protein n=1 Tax=candidate division WWE3 bacterium CG10_big_fil_rev_8_21_14_0_10_32_10 TaxID=1975090 RepID=A0A2H0RAW4_UNCKA|nr:MAG: hypothetical protein COV24_01285 [candidate division WWE3 bacterium CG10_big_fil_rev_8_21_14_0_10_32_10]